MKMLQLVWNVTTRSEVKGQAAFPALCCTCRLPWLHSMLNPNESCKAENPHWNAVPPSQILLSFTAVLSACGTPGREEECALFAPLWEVTGSQHGGASSLRQQDPCTETYSACVGLLLPTQGWWQTLCFILRSPRLIRVDLTDDVTEPPFKNCQLVMNDLVKKHTQARVKCSLTKPTDILCSCAGSARAGAANQSGQLGHWESSSVLHQHLGSQQQRSHPGAAPCPHHTDKPQPIFNWLRKWRWFL